MSKQTIPLGPLGSSRLCYPCINHPMCTAPLTHAAPYPSNSAPCNACRAVGAFMEGLPSAQSINKQCIKASSHNALFRAPCSFCKPIS